MYMQDQVDLGVELKFDTLCSSVFMRRVIEEARHAFVAAKDWTTDQKGFLGRLKDVSGVEPVVQKTEADAEASVFYFGGALVYLQEWRGQVDLRVAGSRDEAVAIEAKVKDLLPEATLKTRVQVNFWYWASMRGFAARLKRLLVVPTWDEIAGNYPVSTRELLGSLIRDGVEPSSGQLLLWFGEPGSGKTYALRALLREWRDKFSLHYISDTDSFFANGEYMLSVMLNEDEDQWKLFILEDAGEFLVPDARQQMGQGLSRLLNASDGLIGQGLKSMFLITTNEPTSRLHPAVSRPGRCAAQIEFNSFAPDEAGEWLQSRGAEVADLPGELRLADLYSRLRGENRTTRAPVKVGF